MFIFRVCVSQLITVGFWLFLLVLLILVNVMNKLTNILALAFGNSDFQVYVLRNAYPVYTRTKFVSNGYRTTEKNNTTVINKVHVYPI